MNKKIKYIEAIEITKPGKHHYTYVGIELERTKEEVSLLCVGGADWEDIIVEEFPFSNYKIQESTSEKVHHLFTIAFKATQICVLEAEKELLRMKRDLVFHQNKIKQYFGKPLEVGIEEKLMEF